MDISQQTHHSSGSSISIVFDISNPTLAELLHRLRGIVQEHGDIEAIDEDHFLLIIRPAYKREVA